MKINYEKTLVKLDKWLIDRGYEFYGLTGRNEYQLKKNGYYIVVTMFKKHNTIMVHCSIEHTSIRLQDMNPKSILQFEKMAKQFYKSMEFFLHEELPE